MRTHNRFTSVVALAAALVMMLSSVALASDVDVAVVDVTAPQSSVTLAPGGSDEITINMSVTGAQAGTATFEVYRDWTLAGGVFSGTNPQEFSVAPRSGGDPATTFRTTGTVTVAADQADGTYTLAVGAFDITNSNATGAKLSAGDSSSYQVGVETPVVSPADRTAPEITITTPADGAVYKLHETVNAEYSCTDESSVPVCSGPVADGSPIDTSSVGTKSFTVDAEDEYGNDSSATHTYSVIYDFTGFYRPIDNLPTLNRVKAGSAVPVKFSLAGNQGLAIFAAGHPGSKTTPCDATAPADSVEETVTAGSSSLSYDALADQYSYVWKTDKGWTGCRQLQLKFADGQIRTAMFQFTK